MADEAVEQAPLWVEWLNKDRNFANSFEDTLKMMERQAVEQAMGKPNVATTEMYEARGVYLAIRRLRHYMTMHEREAQANAHRTATRQAR